MTCNLSNYLAYSLIMIGYVLWSSSLLANQTIKNELSQFGITIASIPAKKVETLDISVTDPETGNKKIKDAIELIFEKSPFNTRIIGRLSEFGKIFVIYDPSFPKKQLASQKIAAFFPDFYQHEGDIKQFRVVVGRYGIKWPLERLAAVLVHELAGHGLQHLRKRTLSDRKIDRECEALIYEEKAYQDFKTLRNTPERRNFLNDMRFRWCADFNWYLTKNKVNTDQAWGYGRPDVTKLLGLFEKYIDYLRKTGTSANAVKASKDKRISDFEKLKKLAISKNDFEGFFLIGNRYLTGIGVERNFAQARYWFQQAAAWGHANALFLLGVLYERGLGVKINHTQAYKWFSLSVESGLIKADEKKTEMSLKLSKSELQLSTKEIMNWQNLIHENIQRLK